jgi:hypothetical protein
MAATSENCILIWLGLGWEDGVKKRVVSLGK